MLGSAFAQRVVLGFDDGFEQVAHDRFMTGLDMHRGQHAGDDRQRFICRAEEIVLGTNADDIETASRSVLLLTPVE